MLRRNILLVIGLLALVAGAAISVLWIRQQAAPGLATGPAPQHVTVLAAAHAIPSGTMLRLDDMIWTELPADAAAPGALKRGRVKEGDYVGALTRRAFAAGEALVASALIKPEERGFLAAVLAPGYRAVTISVDAPQTASGLVVPGDHVDVILTQNLTGTAAVAGRRSVGETVLSDVRVVAVDQSLSAAARPVVTDLTVVRDLRPPRTITLELTEPDVQKLLVALQLGRIDLSVRPPEAPRPKDQEVDGTTRPTWAADVSPAIRALDARPAPAPAPAAPAPKSAAPATPAAPARLPIEVMHGAKIELR
jgi:pilus assembly protein CpaB